MGTTSRGSISLTTSPPPPPPLPPISAAQYAVLVVSSVSNGALDLAAWAKINLDALAADPQGFARRTPLSTFAVAAATLMGTIILCCCLCLVCSECGCCPAQGSRRVVRCTTWGGQRVDTRLPRRT